MSYYQIERFEGYIRIGSPEAIFCYILEGENRAILVDTGYAYGDIRSVVCQATEKPLIIVNTHGHCDHTGGNAQFEQECLIHAADVGLCKAHNSVDMRRENALRAMHSVDYATGKEFNALPEDFDMEHYVGMGAGILRTVEPGTVFDLGGITAEILFTPGHTQGGISVWCPERKLAFIGDATGFFVWLHLGESTDQKAYVDMLDRLYALDAEKYLGGHNPVPMTREDLLTYKRAALEADFETGEPFQTFLEVPKEGRVCARSGMTMSDMMKPGFASVVINEDWGK